MAWEIIDGKLTNTEFLPLPENAMTKPYPLSLWRIEDAELKTGLMPNLPENAMTKPYPLALWRIDPTANDGYPFTELMPNIEKINLWIQPSRPLIHIYGTKAVRDSDFDSNGYAIFEPISAEVYQERNGEYSASFETHCDKFKKFMYIRKQALVKIPIKYHGKVRQQIFRIIDTVRKMNSDDTYRISAQAVHLFYGNNRFLIRSSHPTQMTGADALPYIANHSTYNTEAYPYICTSDIQLTRTAYYDNMSITEALLGADQAFVNRWGGKLYRDNFYFSINKETEGYQTAGVIEYGYNLTDIEFEEDDTDIITDLIAEDNFGNKYHASVPDNELTVPHRIFKHETFSYDVESISTFHADAEAYLEEYKQSTVSITVNFLNLSNLDKYKQFRSLDSYEVGDKVILYHKDLGIYYSNLEIISKRYDVLSQKTLEIEIGRFKNAISRERFMAQSTTNGASAEGKMLAAMQEQVNKIAYDTYINTPITTADGKYLTTSDGKFLLYKEE